MFNSILTGRHGSLWDASLKSDGRHGRMAARWRPAHDVRLLHISIPNMVGNVKFNECIK